MISMSFHPCLIAFLQQTQIVFTDILCKLLNIDSPLTDTSQMAASICMRGIPAELQMWRLLVKYPREGAKRCQVT